MSVIASSVEYDLRNPNWLSVITLFSSKCVVSLNLITFSNSFANKGNNEIGL